MKAVVLIHPPLYDSAVAGDIVTVLEPVGVEHETRKLSTVKLPLPDTVPAQTSIPVIDVGGKIVGKVTVVVDEVFVAPFATLLTDIMPAEEVTEDA